MELEVDAQRDNVKRDLASLSPHQVKCMVWSVLTKNTKEADLR